MESSFRYRSIDSSDYGLILSAPPIIGAAMRETRETIPGRSGTLKITDESYGDIAVTYQANFLADYRDVEQKSREIKAWLLGGGGVYELSDSFDADYFRMGSYSGSVEIESIFLSGGSANLTFACGPFKYLRTGQFIQSLASPGSIYSFMAFSSEPYIKVYGNGNGTLYITNSAANQSITISNIDGFVELDSEIAQAFKGNVSKNADVILSEFPIFTPGENLIQWGENISKIEFIPRWRTL